MEALDHLPVQAPGRGAGETCADRIRSMRFFSADESVKQDTQILFDLWRRGDWTRRPIAGESFHDKEIRALLPTPLGEQSIEVQTEALLIPEPANRHDPHAVKVVIGGHHVGYLSKDDAPLYQPLLVKLLDQGFQPVVPARIWAYESKEWTGTDRRGRDIYEQRLTANVTLALDEPHLCVPVNLPPQAAHATLPFGSAIQLKGEEEHQDTLVRYLHPAGEQWAYATLTTEERLSARTFRQVVVVSLDGAVVGELTPAMSTEFMPVIERLREAGKVCAARVLVKGNLVKVDVVLHATKAGALDQGWLAEHLAPVRTSTPTTTAQRPADPQQVVEAQAPHTEASALAATASHALIPPRPSKVVFRVPESWPQPPDGWEPPAGWEPPSDWPPAPKDWQFWSVAW